MTEPGQPSRNVAIDNLRTSMMCVVMFGHAMLPYLTAPRRFEDPSTHIGFDVVGVFLYAFAMQAFFVTAGFAAAGLYRRRGARAFWRNRWARIFLPLLVGYLLLTPLTRAAYLFAQTAADSGSLAAGWDALSAGRWLRWGKVYHLWFLASLLVFSAFAIALDRIGERAGIAGHHGWQAFVELLLGRRLSIVWLTLLVGALTVPAYIGGTGQGTAGWMQAALFVFFAVGWCLYGQPAWLARLTRQWWIGPMVAIACLPLCAWATLIRLSAERQIDVAVGIVAGLTNAAIAVGMTLGLLGAFLRHLDRQGPFARYASEASYWIYLVHYPIVIAAGGLISVVPSPPTLKYLLAVAIALPLILASYELLVRRGPLAGVLGPARAASRGR